MRHFWNSLKNAREDLELFYYYLVAKLIAERTSQLSHELAWPNAWFDNNFSVGLLLTQHHQKYPWDFSGWKHMHKNGYNHEVRNDISDNFNNAFLLTYIAYQLLGSKTKY